MRCCGTRFPGADPGRSRSPHQEITRFARCNAFDTLVLGAAALGTGGVLGSTAERVLNRTPCNLVLVQPPSRRR
ncbi:universal stress protein [Pseudomonas rhodesiae]|uniref:universal stress protein n=1 Tax=Pseudomonas rhodesiae TaxID=76760 RepID=UPI0035A6710D